MRRFKLVRKEDIHGCSGTGHVADGCVFKGGQCVLVWKSDHPSLNIYKSVEDVVALHGHEGRTYVEWIDDETHDSDWPAPVPTVGVDLKR